MKLTRSSVSRRARSSRGAGQSERTTEGMPTERIEAFSDGVFSVILTIMVLELRAPRQVSWATLATLLPPLLIYFLSFIVVAIIWVNHHRAFYLTPFVNQKVLWLNNHLLLWVSLIPFVTALVGQDHGSSVSAALYGVVMLGGSAAFSMLRLVISRLAEEPGSQAESIHRSAHRRNIIGLSLYAISIGAAFLSPLISYAIFTAVALLYFVPV